MKHFYHHIIQIESIHIALSELDLDPHEQEALLHLANTNIHHSVMDTVLSELSPEDKKTFLSLVAHEEPKHSEIWEFLHLKLDQAESKIENAIEKLLAKMHEDIKEAHKKKTT